MTQLTQTPLDGRRKLVSDRLRQVMVELEKAPSGLEWDELWKRVVAASLPADDDRTLTRSDTESGEADLRSRMERLDGSGWVLTGAAGTFRITSAGRQALRECPSPDSLQAAADESHLRWEQLRKAVMKDPSQAINASAGDLRPTRPGEGAMLVTAHSMVTEGLRRGGSVFSPGRPIWGAETVAALREALVVEPDRGSGSMMGLLAHAGDDGIQLAAEMLSLLLLPADDWKPDSKRTRINEVLALMTRPVALPPEISAAMDHHVLGGGLTLKTHLQKSLVTVVETLSAWWNLEHARRDRAWQDPWAWHEFVEQLPSDTIPSARSELCYLVHPEAFTKVLWREDRKNIVKAFSGKLDSPSGDLDRDVYDITMVLQKPVGPGKVDYYREPWLSQWKAAPSPGQRAWLVRPPQDSTSLVSQWHDDECVSVRATHLPELAPGSDAAAIRAAVNSGYQHVDYAQRQALSTEYFDFLSRMKVDDIVATIAGDELHVGQISGDAEYRTQDGTTLVRPVAWGPQRSRRELDPSITALLAQQGTVVDLTAALAPLAALLPAAEPEPRPVPRPDPVPRLPAVNQSLADSLYMQEDQLQEIVDLLQARQQIVLYGPPGTGKTFLAKTLAAHLVGEDPSRAQLVQFHPSYSYEDFFEGFRPSETTSGQATFTVQPGPLREIASEASQEDNRGEPFVLVIDEMNRANLAKVFGELYFLLEYRDESMRLQYHPTEAFRLPRNLFIIATMNTADRSIALVDSALRRRFAFVELHPDTEPVRDVLPRFLEANGCHDDRAQLLRALNTAIEDHDRDLRVGPSYLMKPEAADERGLERIWKYDILPLLEEHYYGQLTRDEVHQRFGLPALRATISSAAK